MSENCRARSLPRQSSEVVLISVASKPKEREREFRSSIFIGRKKGDGKQKTEDRSQESE